MKFSGKFRWIYHEDVLNVKASDKCIEIAKDYEFDVIGKNDPPIGQGASLTWLLKHVQGDYVINWEDDQAAIREIDLDRIIYIMDKYVDRINQIAFHKREIEKNHYDWVAEEMELEGVNFVTNPHWAYVPAIWRMSYIKPRWLGSNSGNHHWEQNAKLKNQNVNDLAGPRPAAWVMKNTKTFYYGKVAEPAYIKHLGSGNSLREGEYRWE